VEWERALRFGDIKIQGLLLLLSEREVCEISPKMILR
jgi:hypothetical protein